MPQPAPPSQGWNPTNGGEYGSKETAGPPSKALGLGALDPSSTGNPSTYRTGGHWVQGPNGATWQQDRPPVDTSTTNGNTAAEQSQLAAMQNFDSSINNRAAPGVAQSDQGGIMNARAQQEQALGLMQRSAMGQGPSVAQAQTYGQMGSGIAAMNAAGQSRGGPAQAMGIGGSSLNSMSAQGGQARAQEQAGLMNMYGKNAAGLNQADVGQYGMDLKQLGDTRGIGDQQSVLNAQTVYGANQQDMTGQLARQSFLQQSGQLDQQARDAAVANMESGAAVGVGLMALPALAA